MNLAAAAEWVRANAPVGTSGADSAELDRLLVASAARSDDDVVYRIYYVAAHYWQIAAHTRRLRAAEGATFDSPRATVQALLEHQRREDERLLQQGYTIDPAYRVTASLRLEPQL